MLSARYIPNSDPKKFKIKVDDMVGTRLCGASANTIHKHVFGAHFPGYFVPFNSAEGLEIFTGVLIAASGLLLQLVFSNLIHDKNTCAPGRG